mmetsp:Transcript_38966/g.108409  ORF Transcript_38966/g.108409 Transcript_38966/m.108409 type:complete len:267 (-) Transcript_38966:407-1207(-)
MHASKYSLWPAFAMSRRAADCFVGCCASNRMSHSMAAATVLMPAVVSSTKVLSTKTSLMRCFCCVARSASRKSACFLARGSLRLSAIHARKMSDRSRRNCRRRLMPGTPTKSVTDVVGFVSRDQASSIKFSNLEASGAPGRSERAQRSKKLTAARRMCGRTLTGRPATSRSPTTNLLASSSSNGRVRSTAAWAKASRSTRPRSTRQSASGSGAERPRQRPLARIEPSCGLPAAAMPPPAARASSTASGDDKTATSCAPKRNIMTSP